MASKKQKKILGCFFILLLMGGIIKHKYLISKTQDFMRDTFCTLEKPPYSFQHEFAVLNKSFKRDLYRSLQLYKSFEVYFKDAEITPFYIVVPESDLILFQSTFEQAKTNSEIKNLPVFMTEQEVLAKTDEPDVTFSGRWAHQVIKLCFGLTGIAKNYFSIDSDTYFTRSFDKETLFKKGVLKTFAFEISDAKLKQFKENSNLYAIPGDYGLQLDNCPKNLKCILDCTTFGNFNLIKDFFGNKKKKYYTFVSGHTLYSSEVLYRLKQLLLKKGIPNFAKINQLVPFENQWYGEYILQNEKFIICDSLFTLIHDASECWPEDGSPMYGVTYQSMDYSKENFGARKEIRYKRPAHCK